MMAWRVRRFWRRIYRGEWQKGKMQGCGVKLARHNGRDGPVFLAEEGMFNEDEWVGDVMACSVEASRAAAHEADVAASMARAFQVSRGGALARILLP